MPRGTEPTLFHRRARLPGAAAGAGALRRRDADRQPARHHDTGARDAGCGGSRAVRGHQALGDAARSLRHPHAAAGAARAQRAGADRWRSLARSRRRGDRADLGRRHAAALRSRASRWCARCGKPACRYSPCPGASALLAALAVAGLPTDAFGFIGFLPPKSGARDNALEALAGRTRDAGVLRIAAPAGRHARGHGRGVRRRARGRRGAGADQAVRASVARYARGARHAIRRGRRPRARR